MKQVVAGRIPLREITDGGCAWEKGEIEQALKQVIEVWSLTCDVARSRDGKILTG